MAGTPQNGASPYKHPYHLVDPSPWPLVGAFAGGTFLFGIVLFAHYQITWVMVAGLLGVLAVMALWWWDVIKES
ncbi:MAG: cytochrome c oxidase subunit 3, partial [Acetobacteraceae bacterium]